MSYFPKPSLNENDLAIIERGDTAAHSIEAGQYVSWHGRTGKAKAAILQGATLSDSLFDYDEDGVLNASCIKEVTNEFTFSNIRSGMNAIHILKLDQFIMVTGYFEATQLAANTVFITIPDKYAPEETSMVNGRFFPVGSGNEIGLLRMDTGMKTIRVNNNDALPMVAVGIQCICWKIKQVSN